MCIRDRSKLCSETIPRVSAISWGVMDMAAPLANIIDVYKRQHFVLLNLFRDQLDRYGEIDHTQDAIASALASSPETILIFNAASG